MNCDDVFQILTRGPFPCGDCSDELVEQHLIECSSCRQLAEALQPAIELAEEAVTAEESSNLPAYWGELFQASMQMPSPPVPAASKPVRPVLRLSRLRRGLFSRRASYLGRLAATLLLGVVVGLALRGPDATERDLGKATQLSSGRAVRVPRSLTVPATFGPSGLLAICGRSLVGQDKTMAGAEDREAHAFGPNAAWSSVRCCTQCHHAAGENLAGASSTARIIATCGSCHAK